MLHLLIQHQLISSPCRSEQMIFSRNRQEHSFIYRAMDMLVFALYTHGSLHTLHRALGKPKLQEGSTEQAVSKRQTHISSEICRLHCHPYILSHLICHSSSLGTTQSTLMVSGPQELMMLISILVPSGCICVCLPIFPFPALSSAYAVLGLLPAQITQFQICAGITHLQAAVEQKSE